jgi:hypothetical protein
MIVVVLVQTEQSQGYGNLKMELNAVEYQLIVYSLEFNEER